MSVQKIILNLIFIFFFLINGCNNKSKNSQLKPLPQDDFVQVYFNNNQTKGAEYLEPYRQIKRSGDNLEEVIINEINSANSSIDLAVQELNLPNVAQALVNRYQQGIKVRIILENNYNFPVSKLSSNHALKIIKNANLPLIDDTEDGSKGSGLMHHKFMVVDKKKVITGSANYTFSGIHGDFNRPETRGNINHILVIENQELAHIFTEEFNQMWGDGVGKRKDSLFGLKKTEQFPKTVIVGKSLIRVKFSPNSPSQSWQKSTNGLIAKNLEKSDKSVDLALFVFADQNIANSLQKRHQKGVEIRALIDKSFAFRYYSEALDLLGIELLNKCKYEKLNNPWRNPIKTAGTTNLPQGDKLHHKFGIIDDSTIITGSHNWSDSANYRNDETLLIIENSTVAKHFKREFERLYNNSILGIPVYVQDKIDNAKQQCS